MSSWSLWSPRIIPARAGFTVAFRRRARVARDHPRSRGVYSHGPSRRFAQVGSSPLARGLRGDCVGHCGSFRIIPARAGFTPVNSTRAPPTSDHPRSRGVYCGWTPLPARPIGSSPLARGLRRGIEPRCCLRRIIPARAGFTPRARLPHPRPVGSSPLARGLRHRREHRPRQPRIIPARAGFTKRWGTPTNLLPDHPRSRGVYAGRRRLPRDHPGSSPLARGLLAPGHPQRVRHRIIPARAGFTTPARGPALRLSDHPRSRGVYGYGPIRGTVDLGSSPLARGLPVRPCGEALADRIIPARAGFTGEVGVRAVHFRDHPRSRGVYITAST